MRFIVDECTGPTVSMWLAEQGHDVYSVSLHSPGWKDNQVLALANEEKRIIITNDRDFGELIYKFKHTHEGVVFMRLSDETINNKIAVLKRLFDSYASSINHESYITVTEESVRIKRSL